MQHIRSYLALATLATATALTTTSCTGGDSPAGDAAVAPLAVIEQVSLVDAKDSGGATVRNLPAGVLAAGGTDYETDRTEFWVEDESMDALQTVNAILCSIGQTGFDDPSVLNSGPYLALVACDEDRGGGQRGQQGTQYQRFVVDSSRASADAPHIVKFWIEQVDDGIPTVIYGLLTITEAPSATQPNGAFSLYFKGLAASASPSSQDLQFSGALRTVPRTDGQTEFEFFNVRGDVDSNLPNGAYAFRQRARFVGNPAEEAGRAYAESTDAYNLGAGVQRQGTEYHLQFDSSYLARKRVREGSQVKVFDRSQFSTMVHQYGMYDANTETRIGGQGGFSLETTSGENGWVGYHGMWFPQHVDIQNGQALVRRRFGGTDSNYTAVVVPGRLQKRSRESITFASLNGEELEYWAPQSSAPILISWNGTDIVKVATRDNSGSWSFLDPAVPITGDFSTGEYLRFWAPHRGDIEVVWPAAPSDTSTASVWEHSTITGSSSEIAGGDLALTGYFDMIRSQITSSQINGLNNERPYFDDATNVGEGKTYSFDAESLVLQLQGSDCVIANGVTVQSSSLYTNGVFSGPMVTAPLTQLQDIGSVSTTYSWVTGPKDWNQLRTVKDAQGDWVEFDAPIRVSYTHSEPNNRFNGKTLSLEWSGSDLGGIPYRQVPGKSYFAPELNIPSGSIVSDGSRSYKIKQLSGEQRMLEVGNPTAVMTSQGFDLDTTLSAPSDEWTNPHDDAMPTVTAAPKFVGGVKQGDS